MGLLIAGVFGAIAFYFGSAHNRYHQSQVELEKNERRLQAVSELQLVADQVRERLASAYELERSRLILLADLAAVNNKQARGEFNRRVKNMADSGGLYYGIVFADASLTQKIVYPEENQPLLLDKKLILSPGHEAIINGTSQRPVPTLLSPLLKLPNGVSGFHLDAPVHDKNILTGFISMSIALKPFVQEALGRLDKIYGIKIYQGKNRFYSNVAAAKSDGSFTRSFTFSPDGAQQWSVEILMADVTTPLFALGNAYDLAILVIGVVATLFVSFLVYRLINLLRKSRDQDMERSLLLTRIQRSERELFSFIDSANVILIVVDELGMVTLCNYTMQKYTSFTPAYMKGKIWWKEFNIPEDQMSVIEKVFAGRKSVENLETSITTADGQARSIIWNIGPSATDQGFRFVCVGRDVTERRQNAAALRLTEERFQILFEEMKEGVIATDTEGRITQINGAAREILKLPKGKIEGHSLKDIFPRMIDEEGDPLPAGKFAPLVSLREKYPLYGFVAGLEHEGKETVWIYGSSGVLNINHTFFGLIVTFSDITGIKNAEAEVSRGRESLKQIILNMQSGVILCDARNRVEVYNPQFTKMWDIPPDWPDHHPGFDGIAARIAEKSLNHKQVLTRLQTALANPAPEQFELAIHDTQFVEFFTTRLADGYRLWTFRDVSQARLLEKQLQQAQKMESVGQLAGGLAHDFNNILTVVNGYLALALEQTDSKDKRHTQLKRTQEALSRAVGITRKLLTFSRGDIFRKETISLNDTIRESVELLSRSVPGNIKIQYILTAGDKKIFADRGAMDQMIVNLCLNAVDAMPNGGMISISTVFLPVLDAALSAKLPQISPHGYIRWSVKDSGTGIPPEIMSRIFEPFFTTKQNKSGTGLGLAMVYGICRSHGGYVEVESDAGHGTTFTIYLPVTNEKTFEESEELKENMLDYSLFKSKTILLVDDEDMVLEMVGDLLEDKGVIVYTAINGQEALELAQKFKGMIDLVVTDMVMPGMSGLELIDGIRRISPRMDFIVTSGYTIKEQKDELEKRVIHSFLPKPYTPLQLFRLLQDYFAQNPATR